MAFTITSPRLITNIQLSDLSPQTAIEGGVRVGPPTGAFPTVIAQAARNSEFTNRHLGPIRLQVTD